MDQENSTASVSAVYRPGSRGRGSRQRGGPRPAIPRPEAQVAAGQKLGHYHTHWGDDAQKCVASCPRWNIHGPIPSTPLHPVARPARVFHVEQEEEQVENLEN